MFPTHLNLNNSLSKLFQISSNTGLPHLNCSIYVETGISSGLMGHLARMQTVPYLHLMAPFPRAGVPLPPLVLVEKGLKSACILNRLFEENSSICTFAAILWSAISENDFKCFSLRGFTSTSPLGSFYTRSQLCHQNSLLKSQLLRNKITMRQTL